MPTSKHYRFKPGNLRLIADSILSIFSENNINLNYYHCDKQSNNQLSRGLWVGKLLAKQHQAPQNQTILLNVTFFCVWGILLNETIKFTENLAKRWQT